MVDSKRTAPHAWTMVEVDVTNVWTWRTREKDAFERAYGVKLTLLPFFIRGVVESLAKFPLMNASFTDEGIRVHRDVNVGIAIAAEGNLVVPVIRDADKLSVKGLALAAGALIDKARRGKLGADDLAGGTFTVNNTGANGAILSAPILVPGQTGDRHDGSRGEAAGRARRRRDRHPLDDERVHVARPPRRRRCGRERLLERSEAAARGDGSVGRPLTATARAGIGALAALVVATIAPAIGAIDDEPGGLVASSTTLARVRALYEHAHLREHTRAATVLEDWRLFQEGTVGSFRVNRLGKDVRESTALGPVTYERGVLRGVHWEQDRNGVVFTYPGIHEQRDAASEHAFRDASDDRDVRVVGDSPAFAAYVVEVNPPAGRHEWLYIDKRSGYVVRREYVERRRRYTTTYDDYRIFDGVPEPSRVRTVDSLGNEREQILVSRTLDTTPDLRDVDMPPSRRVVEFPERQSSVRLPVRFVNGLAIVRVIVGRAAYDFLLDSGAAGIFIDPSVAEQQGFDVIGKHVGATMGSFPESTAIVPQMTIGGLRMRGVVTRVVKVPFRVGERTHVAGLLGFDFFADTIVHLDIGKTIAEALPPEKFRAPSDTSTIALALDDKTPTTVAHAGSANGRVIIDTGANRTVFETSFADRADFSPDRVAGTTHVRGMGGVATAEATRVPTFEMGGIWTRGATADIANADLGADDVDGVIGTDFLRTYDMWFDYRNSAIHLRRAKR